jgi:acyl-coenzyme A thioesterase PaaI-like protein
MGGLVAMWENRKGTRVCHVRVRVSQDERLVAEGSAVYAIHRRRSEG